MTDIKKTCEHYILSTDINCFLIDNDGEVLYKSETKELNCYAQCKLANYCKGCKEVHIYGSSESRRFGGRYIYFCPYGLTFIAVSLYNNNQVGGALICGPIMMIKYEQMLFSDILSKNNVEYFEFQEIKQYIDSLPVVSPERVTALSEVLYAVVPAENKEPTEIYDQQVHIATSLINMKDNLEEKDLYPIFKERDLLSAIIDGDKKVAQKHLNEVLGHIYFSSGMDIKYIKPRIIELIGMLSRATIESGADNDHIFGLNMSCYQEIERFRSVNEMSAWLAKILNKYMENIFNIRDFKHSDVLFKATEFVRRNYTNKISIDDVANAVYISPSYFSKIFNEEMNMSFSTYLNNWRVSKSKHYLLDNQHSLVEIANMVGFEDQSYFTKVFKKVVGISPGKFRECRGKIN